MGIGSQGRTGDDMDPLEAHLYTPVKRLRTSLRRSMLSDESLSQDEQMSEWHLTSLFMSKVFDACKRLGVTPRTAGDEVRLEDIMVESEKELGIHLSHHEIELMNRFQRAKTLDDIRRRRSFAYSSLIRMTSNGIIS